MIRLVFDRAIDAEIINFDYWKDTGEGPISLRPGC